MVTPLEPIGARGYGAPEVAMVEEKQKVTGDPLRRQHNFIWSKVFTFLFISVRPIKIRVCETSDTAVARTPTEVIVWREYTVSVAL